MSPPVIMGIGAGLAAVGSILGGQAAMATGRYQQSIAERNAGVYEDKANQALEIGERNVTTFNKAFAKQQASTEAAYISAGVKLSGTPLEILEYNLAEAELESLNIMYDARMQNYDFKQQAVLARMEGNLAMFQAEQQRAASFLNAAGTVIGAYGTKTLLDTQAANQKILMDKTISNETKLINLNKALATSNINLSNSLNQSLLVEKNKGRINYFKKYGELF